MRVLGTSSATMPNRGRLGKGRLPNGPAKDSSGLDYLFTVVLKDRDKNGI